MDGVQIITALAASSGRQARDKYWMGVLDGVELMLDKLADEERPASEWVPEVQNFVAICREHQV